MSGEPCSEHGAMCGKIGNMDAKIDALKASVDRVLENVESHIHEADKPGGVRDRVSTLESTIRIQHEMISTIKAGYWKACIVSAIVGGLFARLAPEMIWDIIHSVIQRLMK